MADIVICAGCGRAYVRRLGVCPNCGNNFIHEVERPKTAWWWAGAAIYYPCFAIILIAFVGWLNSIFKTFPF